VVVVFGHGGRAWSWVRKVRTAFRCTRAHAFLAQHLAKGAQSRARAARDEAIYQVRALDAVHLADLFASRRHTHGCIVWTGA